MRDSIPTWAKWVLSLFSGAIVLLGAFGLGAINAQGREISALQQSCKSESEARQQADKSVQDLITAKLEGIERELKRLADKQEVKR